MLLPKVPVNFVNHLVRADQGLEVRYLFITTLYPAYGFDNLQACSRWCLEGRCHDEQGPPGCNDFVPNNRSPDEASFIKRYGCSQPGCICDPAKGFYQRTIEDAYKCLNSSCRRKDTSYTAFKAEADQVESTIKSYCTSHNITGDYTSNHPQLPTWINTTTDSYPPQSMPFLLIPINHANACVQESNTWKPQDIGTLTVTIFAAIVPIIIAIVSGYALRRQQSKSKRATAIPPTCPGQSADQSVTIPLNARSPVPDQAADQSVNQPVNQPAAIPPIAHQSVQDQVTLDRPQTSPSQTSQSIHG
ncbi:hypothetical protein GQ44DRAFT_819880 [Phaeosphaeriaceae sp. PMI808]|nr:hypothetical protein GQ44DRAFT_819880 [Phaeosphaeriaceae sp. PMI808]